ncbi:MAG: LLM class flavin-dependent oxidoreductase [Acidimicrobiales bacterium]
MPVDEVVNIARLAELLGYADLWIPDQSFHHDPFLLLACCARATSTIRLGVAVTNPVTRHPVQIARAAATLQDIARGRFVLGLGAGNRTRVLPAMGLPTDRPAERIADAIDVCRRLLRGEQVSVDRPGMRLAGIRLEAAVPTDVPIYVGSRGARVLEIAGAMADGVLLEAMFTTAGLDYALGEIERGARRAGRVGRRVETVAWQAIRLSGTLAARDEARYRSWAALLMWSTRPDVLERIGIPPKTIDAVRAAFRVGDEWDAGRLLVEDVVPRLLLAGDADAVEYRLRTVERRGVDSASIIAFGMTEVVQDTLRRFASDVMSRFHHEGPVPP